MSKNVEPKSSSPKTAPVKNDDMGLFMTRDRAGKPRRVLLVDPATNKETSHWLDIRSSLSDEFQIMKERLIQEAPMVAALSEPARTEMKRTNQLRLRSALVAGWSFSQPCTEDNIVNFLREAPQLQPMVIEVADDAASFFGKP
jgi:hypothetical protein